MSETKSGIGGKVREQQDFNKKIGLFAGKVVCVNPNREEFKEILGIELKEESKADEYVGESKDGNPTVRINFWLEEAKTKQKFNVTFFLENKIKSNKDGSKQQYINELGSCSWADDPNNLPDWFVKRGGDSFREAFVGEEELYTFMRTWLGKLDYRDAGTTLQLEFKQLIKGNMKDIKAQINGEFSVPIVALAVVKTVVNEGEDNKEYQGVYNRNFLPEYSLKQFRLVDYDKSEVLAGLKKKASKDLKPHERFALQVSDSEYGCKDSFKLKDLQDYNKEEFLVGSNTPILEDDSSY
jgi:hypothetical protein